MKSRKLFIFLVLCIIAGTLSACASSTARVFYYSYKEKRDLALKYRREGKCHESVTTMKTAVDKAELIKQTLPDNKKAGDPLSEAYKLLGNIYADDSCRMYELALNAYNQSLAIRETIFGKQHPLYANVLNDMAWGYYSSQGKYGQAEKLFLQALDIYLATDNNKKGLFYSYKNLGYIYHQQKQYQKSDQMYESLISIISELYSDKKISAASAKNNIEIYRDMLMERQDREKLNEINQLILRFKD